jgi:regulator of protease activity HflC (stomatin/prohibitin superfamily)
MNIIPPTSESPWPDVSKMFSGPPSRPPPRAQSIKYAVAAVVCMAVIGSVLGSAYTVQPTEMAGVRRLGTVVTTDPVGPGLHFKLPWIDTVDTVSNSVQ